MPELPEVECLARSIRPYLKDTICKSIKIIQPSLREVVDKAMLTRILKSQPITGVSRRSKYLLIETPKGICVVHLGMSGQLLASDSPEIKHKHTHALFEFTDSKLKTRWLHYVDPRRFGIIGGIPIKEVPNHRWFVNLGPEPLVTKQLGTHLFNASRKRKQPVKIFLMDAAQVVGVGNIYASESLFRAGISPKRDAGSLDLADFDRLANCIKETLKEAIASGGTTIKDYRNSSGSPGYFALRLAVYGRKGEACIKCSEPVLQERQGGRSTFFCQFCQI